MKTTLFILCFLFFGIIGYGQVTTKIIEVDLSKPHKNSIRICGDPLLCNDVDSCKCKEESKGTIINECVCKSKWLSVKSREMVSVKLVNGNPFKYNYKIDTKNISFFNDQNITADKVKEQARTEADNKSSVDNHKEPIKDIIKKNEELIQNIDNLNIEVESLYEILKQKNALVEADYSERKEFLDRAKEQLKKNYELLNSFENVEEKSKYIQVKESLLVTKIKAEKSIATIIEKFFSVDLEIYTLPIDLQGKNIDVVEFKLRRFDRETKDEDLSFASTPYNIWIRNGLKIDVSAGIFFTSLYDEEYDKRDDPATAGNKIITLKNSGDYDMAFGSTINTYIRMNSWIVPTLNFGAVITQDEKLQVLLGVGAILGKQERIIFSAGVSMGKVDRIADDYQVGSSYNLGDSGTIPTQSQFKFGSFFGITYNLSKVKKISLDKGIEEN
ncbi:hypothetical protein OA93_13920 [Flavobacterium sp. KMS]|uniref:hypothetical protein n=1 Tax=Flavobacterium sp. KMS TaxID=1566023 RepID=UPI00057E11FE|nr:hypothetical protein [Flavobacterium sp. KMS]KIA97614.1 hypothetical protein OA93_13920 [Flavobacterium sp. KMS]